MNNREATIKPKWANYDTSLLLDFIKEYSVFDYVAIGEAIAYAQAALASQTQQPTNKALESLGNSPDGYHEKSLCEAQQRSEDEKNIKMREQLESLPFAASKAQQHEPVSNFNHSDIALLKQWFNAVQDLNPKYLNECDFQLLAKLQSQAQQTESQWKPIATAPKNKKIIVRYKNVCDKDRTVFAKYIEEFTEEANSETECETDYHEERDTYYFKEGWVEMIDNWDEFSCVYFDSRNVPTHWMDIPPAPEGDKP